MVSGSGFRSAGYLMSYRAKALENAKILFAALTMFPTKEEYREISRVKKIRRM